MAILTASKQQMQNAINAARAMGGARRVTYLGGYSYRVEGSTGTLYNVDWQGSNVRCNCPAGAHDRICKHIACTWLRRMGQEAMVRGAAVAS